MRRLMAATALAVLCATAAACSDSGDTPSASASGGNATASSATASAAATSAAGSGNTKQICEDAQKVIAESVTKFSEEVGKLTSSSDTAAAVQTVKTMFNDWADGMRELAGKATDAQLKAALTETAEQIAKVAGSIRSMNDLAAADKLLDSPELQSAQAKFESFCG